MQILIKNGRIIDPANNLDAILDLVIKDGKVARVDKDINVATKDIIDATNHIVMPGLIDMHVHLRQPGREDKETIASGTKAAAKGGVTSLLAMANTEPPIDSVRNVRLLKDIISKDADINVLITATITKERQGKELTDFKSLKKEGAVAVSDDGNSVDCDEVMLEAFKKAKKERLLVICHCEDRALSNGGVVNLGFTSTRLGLKGVSKESEYKRVQRDINLAAKADAAVHIAHVSCAESVEIIAKARKKGIKVTAETAPHHFSLTEEDLKNYNTNMKMNPPLRNRTDLEAIRRGLASGVIDVIASDHAPHTENEKAIEFDRAEFGVIGLETELAVGITELVDKGILSWKMFVRKVATNPAKILGINKGMLSCGADADIIIVDPNKEWLVEKNSLLSKSKNSPFLGRKLKGKVLYSILNGKVIFSADI